MASNWGPTQKKCQRAREQAVRRLLRQYPADYLSLLDEERQSMGLPPLRGTNRKRVLRGEFKGGVA